MSGYMNGRPMSIEVAEYGYDLGHYLRRQLDEGCTKALRKRGMEHSDSALAFRRRHGKRKDLVK